MTTNLLTISEKIDKPLVDLLGLLTSVSGKLGTPFFVIGATARDMVLKYYDETPTRATRDVDIGILVPGWEQFNDLRDALLGTKEFEPSEVRHRLYSHVGMPVDIVPFGEIAGEQRQLRWPKEENRIMSVLGFDEAYDASLLVRVRREPLLDVRVASLPGIVITKLISWSDMYAERKRDALDIHVIMTRYIDAGGLERISSAAKDLIKVEEEVDIELAGARLLGRDIAHIASPRTLKVLMKILKREMSDGEGSRLLADMTVHRSFHDEGRFMRTMEFLRAIETGLRDSEKPLIIVFNHNTCPVGHDILLYAEYTKESEY